MNIELEYQIYLKSLNLMDSTINSHLENYTYFDNWALSQNIINKSMVTASAILDYAKFMKSKGLHIQTRNIRLVSIEKFYNMLKKEGVVKRNPVKDIRIKGIKKTVIQHPLKQNELNDLYLKYVDFLESKPKYKHIPNQAKVNERYKLIVSLMVYQGLHTGELNKLTKEDVNISNATIYIPACSRSESRIIEIKSNQLIAFYHYLDKLPLEQEKLFAINVEYSMNYILSQLKGINPMIQNARQLRASVIIDWIKLYGKRKAMYMIGHKYISTTESYELQDTTELGEKINKVSMFG